MPDRAAPHAPRCVIERVDGGTVHRHHLEGPVGQVTALRLDDVVGALDAASRWQDEGHHVVGFVAYDAAPAFDPAFSVPGTPRQPGLGSPGPAARVPLAWFGAFARSRTWRGPVGPAWPRVPTAGTGPSPGPDGVDPGDGVPPWGRGDAWVSDLDAAEHAASVAAVREAIARGDTYLTNLTTRLRRPLQAGDTPARLYDRLHAGHGTGLHVLLDTGPWAVASGSPELFFELEGDRLTTRPIKGTARRGRWAAEDDALADGLARSAKERAENLMIVDLLRNDLGRLAVTGSVHVPRLWSVERHPALHQLTSTVTARLRPGAGVADVFAALFPCGSVTGAPKVATMSLIAQLERSPRGVYCGAVGLLEPGGRSTFSVAIRTAVVDRRAGVVEYGSGGGITWESDSGAEWAEIGVKAAVLTRPPRDGGEAPSGLLETMGFDPGLGAAVDGVRDLGRHLARLEASARVLGFPVPCGARSVVEEAVAHRDGPARVRLVLHRDGALDIGCDPVPPVRALGPPSGVDPGAVSDAPSAIVCIDPEPVEAEDPSLFHKSTDRDRYDRRAERHPDADDVVLVNDRGEVTETTRANLAVCRDGVWVTPPLASGLLPGIGRQRLLDDGVLIESVVTPEDVCRAPAVATFSSLRGWRPVRVVDPCRCPGQTAVSPVRPVRP